MRILMVLFAILAFGTPPSVWVSMRNELKSKDAVVLFVDDEAKPRCEAESGVLCNCSVEQGTHRFTVKLVKDSSVCLEVPPKDIVADFRLKLRECTK